MSDHRIDPKTKRCRICGKGEAEILGSDPQPPCDTERIQAERDHLHSRVESDLSYHKPTDQTVSDRLEANRAHGKQLAHFLIENCPPGRELSMALTNLQQAMMWANAALVINQ